MMIVLSDLYHTAHAFYTAHAWIPIVVILCLILKRTTIGLIIFRFIRIGWFITGILIAHQEQDLHYLLLCVPSCIAIVLKQYYK
jgi:hypothetical protein